MSSALLNCVLCLNPHREEQGYLPHEICDRHVLSEYKKILDDAQTEEYKILEVEYKLGGLESNDNIKLLVKKLVLSMYMNEVQKRKLI